MVGRVHYMSSVDSVARLVVIVVSKPVLACYIRLHTRAPAKDRSFELPDTIKGR